MNLRLQHRLVRVRCSTRPICCPSPVSAPATRCALSVIVPRT